jgi:hypothetical protein
MISAIKPKADSFFRLATIAQGVEHGRDDGLDFNEDGDANGGIPNRLNTITFGHDIVGKLAGYRILQRVSTDAASEWVGTFDWTHLRTDG